MSALTVFEYENPAMYFLDEQKMAKIDRDVHIEKSYKTLNAALKLFAENPRVSHFVTKFPSTCLKLVAMLPDVKFEGQNDLTPATVKKVISVFYSLGLFEVYRKNVVIPCLDGEVYTNKNVLCFSNSYFKKLLEEQKVNFGENYVLNLNIPDANGIVPHPLRIKKHYAELILKFYFERVAEISLEKDEWVDMFKLAFIFERDSNELKFWMIDAVLKGSNAAVEIFETLFLLLRSNGLDPTLKFDLEISCLKLLLDQQKIAYEELDNGFYLNIKDLYILDSKSIINRTLGKHVRGITVDPEEQTQHLDFFMFLDEKVRSKLKFLKPTENFVFANIHFLSQNAENYRMKILKGKFLFDISLPFKELKINGFCRGEPQVWNFKALSSADFISILELLQKNGIDTIVSDSDPLVIQLDDNLYTYLMKLDKKVNWTERSLSLNLCTLDKDIVKFTTQPNYLPVFQEKIEKIFGLKSRRNYGVIGVFKENEYYEIDFEKER